MFFSKRLSKCKNISHGFFNRSGGKSSGIYKSLNCGIGSNDKRYKIKQNLKIVKNKINRKAKEIFFVRQVHSNKFVFIDKHFKIKKKRVSADAIVTNQKMLPIAILTADCVPLLIHDKKNNKFFKVKYKKLYFDLPKYVKSCLLKNKIKNIESLNIDTYDINNNFFSARRALRLNHDDYGRNISIIMLY